MTLEKLIDKLKNNLPYDSRLCQPPIQLNYVEQFELLDLLRELQDRRESDLRPATKFFGIGPWEQFKHFISEMKEVTEAFHYWRMWAKDAINLKRAKDELVMEIVDLQMSGETLLAELGYNERMRSGVRRNVIAKNKARGYYEKSK